MALGGAPCSGQTTQTNGAPVGLCSHTDQTIVGLPDRNHPSFGLADMSDLDSLNDAPCSPDHRLIMRKRPQDRRQWVATVSSA